LGPQTIEIKWVRTNNYKFHTFRSVHFDPSLYLPDPPSDFRGSGSETRPDLGAENVSLYSGAEEEAGPVNSCIIPRCEEGLQHRLEGRIVEEMDRTTNWLMILCVRGPRAHADQQINLILSQALDLQHWLGITDPVIHSSSKTTLPWTETGGV